MDCINWEISEYNKLLDKGHTITTLTTAVNQFKELYGEDAIPSLEWLANNSQVDNKTAQKESGFNYASIVSWQQLKNLRHRIGLRNNALFAKGINRVYRCPDTPMGGDRYKVTLVQNVRQLNAEAKMNYLSQEADIAGKYNTPEIESLRAATVANSKLYKAKPAPKNAVFNINKYIAKEFAVDVNHPNFDTVSGRILDNIPDFDLPVENKHQNIQDINSMFEHYPELANSVYEAAGVNVDLKTAFPKVETVDKFDSNKTGAFFSDIDGTLQLPSNFSSLSKETQKEYLQHEYIHLQIWNKFGKSGFYNNKFSSRLFRIGKELFKKYVDNRTFDDDKLEILKTTSRNKDILKDISKAIKNTEEFFTYAFTDFDFANLLKEEGHYDEIINWYKENISSEIFPQITTQQKQQAVQVYSQYLNSLNKPNTNPILQTNQEEQVKKFTELQERLNNKEFLEGAKNAYESSKGLQEWGTQEEYTDYIARVSLGIIKNPSSGDYNYTSQVKDIVYHGSKKSNIEVFNKDFLLTGYGLNAFGKGFSFSKLIEYAKSYGDNIYMAILNINKPNIFNEKHKLGNLTDVDFDSSIIQDGIEYVVFEPEQIHILGSKQDIKGFKEFVSDNTDLMADEGYTKVEEDDFNSLFDPKFGIKKEEIYPDFAKVEEDTYEQLSTEVIAKSPAAIIRESKDERFYQLAKNMQSKTSYHYRRYQQFNTKIRNHESGKNILSEQALEIAKKNAAKEYHEIQKVENQRLDIIKFKALEEIELVAEQQLTEMSKMLDGDSVTLSELSYMYDLVNTWIDARAKHIFFSDEEKAVIGKNLSSIKPILDKFDSWHTRALGIKDRLNTISATVLTRIVKEEFNNSSLEINPNLTSLSEQDLKDIDYITKMTIDIAEYGNDVLTMLSKLHKKASYASQKAAEEIVKDIDDMVKAANPILKQYATSGSRYDILMQNQSNTDSRKTGNLVDMNTQKYWNAEKEHNFGKRSIFRVVKSAFQWMKENEMIFDPRILFDDTVPESAKQKHIRELKEHLGEVKYAKLYALAKRRVDNYKENLKIEREIAEETYDGNMALVEEFMAMYEKLNSPYKIAEYIEKGYTFDRKFTNNPVLDYIVRVPRKTINGVETGYYDNKYDVIYQKGNEALAELYEYTLDKMEELKQLIPHYNVDLLQRNVLPEAQASIIEMFARGGLKGKGMLRGLAAMWSTVRSQLSTTEDELSDTQHKTIQTKLNNSEKQQIKKYVNLMSIQHKRDNPGEKITKDMISEWTKDITSQIAGYKSFDLSKNLKAFALNCLSYYHKEQMEGIVQIAQKYIDANNDEGQINNIKQAINYFADTFYGYPDKKKEIKMAGKVTRGVDAKGNPIKEYRPGMKAYSKVEKILKDKIVKEKRQNEKELKVGTITEEIFKARQDVLNKYLDETGSVPTLSQHADQLLKYIQYVGMGWNITAGISNFLFGSIANIIESGDGRLFNQKQLMKAYRMVVFESGILKTTTAGILKTKHAQKITALMKRLDTLKEMKYELITKSPTTSSKLLNKLNFLNPMKIQSATEFLNQAPVLIASLMNINIVDKDGKTDSLWNALNNKGTLKENFRTPENLKNYEGDYMNSEDNKELYKVKARIDEAVKVIHGNYDPDSPLLFKKFWLGRALGQFRRWMPMSFRDRFGAEHYNQLTDMTRKGRYKSGLTVGGAGLSFIPALFGVPSIIGATAMTLLGGTVSYSPVQDELNRRINLIKQDKSLTPTQQEMQIDALMDSVGFEWGGKRHTGILAQTLFQTEYLLKKLTFGLAFKGADYKKFGFSEVDAANLKKNLNELLLLTLLQVLKGFAKLGDDDEDEKSDYEFFVNIALNQLNRMEMDLQLYTSPSQFIGIAAGRVMPVMKLLDQYLKLQQILNTYGDFYANGKSKKSYVRGINKGRNKLEVWAQQAIPGWAQIDKTKKLGEQVMTGQAYKH